MHRRVFIGSALVSLFTITRALLIGLGGNVPASTLPALTPPAPVVATFTAVDKALLAKQMDAYYNGLHRYLALAGVSGDILSLDDYQRFVLNPTDNVVL